MPKLAKNQCKLNLGGVPETKIREDYRSSQQNIHLKHFQWIKLYSYTTYQYSQFHQLLKLLQSNNSDESEDCTQLSF